MINTFCMSVVALVLVTFALVIATVEIIVLE